MSIFRILNIAHSSVEYYCSSVVNVIVFACTDDV